MFNPDRIMTDYREAYKAANGGERPITHQVIDGQDRFTIGKWSVKYTANEVIGITRALRMMAGRK